MRGKLGKAIKIPIPNIHWLFLSSLVLDSTRRPSSARRTHVPTIQAVRLSLQQCLPVCASVRRLTNNPMTSADPLVFWPLINKTMVLASHCFSTARSSGVTLAAVSLPQVHHQQLNRTKIAHVATVPSIPPFHIDLLAGASGLRVEPQRRGQGSGPGQEASIVEAWSPPPDCR